MAKKQVAPDHFLKFRPSEQGFEAVVVCKVLEENRDGKCLELPYKTTCWMVELWGDVGLDCLEKSPAELPWVFAPVKGRIDGHGEDAEGWIVPMTPEEVTGDNPV